MKNFIANSCNNGIAIDDNILKEKALELAKIADFKDFKSSNGYLQNFKKRNAIIFSKIQGEAGGVDENVISRWFGEQLNDLIANVDPDNIFHYYNTTAWMTGVIFLNFLEKINIDMMRANRSILSIIAILIHQTLVLQTLKLSFFPLIQLLYCNRWMLA